MYEKIYEHRGRALGIVFWDIGDGLTLSQRDNLVVRTFDMHIDGEREAQFSERGFEAKAQRGKYVTIGGCGGWNYILDVRPFKRKESTRMSFTLRDTVPIDQSRN
jgi:hypothetical protein